MHNSHIWPNCLSGLVLVPTWPDNRGWTVWDDASRRGILTEPPANMMGAVACFGRYGMVAPLGGD